jgi:hypothetical protein
MQCGRTGSLLVLLSLLAGVLFVASSFAIGNVRDLKGLNATSPDAENWCIGANGIVLCGSLRVAGAIDYLAWNGMQFINAADHGRELQYAISNQYGECYNPTEAGSMNDGAGPTTSSVLLGANTNGNIYRTVSKPVRSLRCLSHSCNACLFWFHFVVHTRNATGVLDRTGPAGPERRLHRSESDGGEQVHHVQAGEHRSLRPVERHPVSALLLCP